SVVPSGIVIAGIPVPKQPVAVNGKNIGMAIKTSPIILLFIFIFYPFLINLNNLKAVNVYILINQQPAAEVS
ncbi:MAG: hypothetical protein ACXWFZ_12715, partial [Nitrososphaeraceae archaeon]